MRSSPFAAIAFALICMSSDSSLSLDGTGHVRWT